MGEIDPEFVTLRERKERVSSLLAHQLDALGVFHNGGQLKAPDSGPLKIEGFSLNPPKAEDEAHLSISSTTTCVRSLAAAQAGLPTSLDFTPVLKALEERYDSKDLKTTGLRHGNSYTLGQMLPAVRTLTADPEGDEPKYLDYAVRRLKDTLKAKPPGVTVEKTFPPNGFLTYWALVSLDVWGRLSPEDVVETLKWSADELYKHLAYFGAQDDEADAFQLGYNLLIQRRFQRSQTKDSIVEAALETLFGAQLPRGVWERREKIFVYGRKHGDAYPFSFELLNGVLREFADSPHLLAPYEEQFEKAVEWAIRNAYGRGGFQWRSGHKSDTSDPESWATAEVYFFFINYRRHLSARLSRLVRAGLGRSRPAKAADSGSFAVLHQPETTIKGEGPVLLGELLESKMLSMLARPGAGAPRYSLAADPLRSKRARSGIFYGPPGTGKTTYAKAIADYLGWPMITITPADFAAEGMLLIPTVGRRLFDQLSELEDVVILFDEMEELFHSRASEDDDDDAVQITFEQRFLTTSFLPALQELRDRATCIYLVATNALKSLDSAARAPRRFDFQIQVGPPAFSEKERWLSDLYGGEVPEPVAAEMNASKDRIMWATRSETKALFDRFEKGDEPRTAVTEAEFSLEDEKADLVKDAEKDNSFDAP